MLLGLAGFTARGVSFCEVVSRLTLTTRTGPAGRALKLGVPSSWVVGASRQPANKITAAVHGARTEVRRIRCSREESEGWNRRRISDPCNLVSVYLASRRRVSIFPL